MKLGLFPRSLGVGGLGSLILGWGLMAAWLSWTVPLTAQTSATTTRSAADTHTAADTRQYYELRVYRIFDYEKQQSVDHYLQTALLPALGRQNIGPVGVFHRADDDNDHAIFALIPFANLEQWSQCRERLADDPAYQQAAAEYFGSTSKEPWYERIDTRLLRAMTTMPQLVPPQPAAENRVYELRLYESHTEDHARRKVQMFNVDEIRIMQEAGLGPVFFSETMIGKDVPNLVYMLSSESAEKHQQAWKQFLAHPDWLRIKDLEVYRDTVSKIEKWMLRPTPYSQW